MSPMTCPKCKKGEMKLLVRNKGSLDPATYSGKGGAKVVCTSCKYEALPSEVRQQNKSR